MRQEKDRQQSWFRLLMCQTSKERVDVYGNTLKSIVIIDTHKSYILLCGFAYLVILSAIFVIYGVSGPSLLIESTDSVMMKVLIQEIYLVNN